jgi:hypothetical protein
MTDRESTSPLKTEQPPSSPDRKRQSNAWNVGWREVVAAMLGVLLYGLLSHANVIVLISTGTPDVFLPALLIPLLFGAIYGPWVGLVVGGFGFLLGDYIANAWLANFVWDNGYIYAGNFFGGALVNFRDLVGWNGIPGYLANGLVGMVAGFATAGPRRRFNDVYALATIGVVSAIAVTTAIAMVVYSAVPLYNSTYYSPGQATVAFFDTALPNLLVALVLLPALLWLYDKVALRRR